jgi:hypothetical protein
MLVHVVFALLALMAFSAFAIDYGVLWASRRQAQNSADAAALAGAGAFMDDPLKDQTDTGPAKQTALQLSQVNPVWGQSPSVNVTTDITFPPCPDEDLTASCVRADVYRTQARSNPVPMFFGSLFALTQQDIRAMAIAKIATANGSDCLKPWGIADKWTENNPVVGATWDPTQTYDPTGPNPDVYVPQNGSTPGSGFKLPDDYGVELTLKVGSPGDTISPGWFQALDLGVCGHGASCYRDEIRGCVGGSPYGIGDMVPKKTGNMQGPTEQGTQDLIDLDPNADWDPMANGGKGAIVGSCTQPGNPPCPGGLTYAYSPRIVAVPVFNLDLFLATGGPGNGTVQMVNILGFFVDRLQNTPPGGQDDVVGYLVTKPDLVIQGKGGVAGAASFIKALVLVR